MPRDAPLGRRPCPDGDGQRALRANDAGHDLLGAFGTGVVAKGRYLVVDARRRPDHRCLVRHEVWGLLFPSIFAFKERAIPS
jgi:hypothetical protein